MEAIVCISFQIMVCTFFRSRKGFSYWHGARIEGVRLEVRGLRQKKRGAWPMVQGLSVSDCGLKVILIKELRIWEFRN
jgi:hypothetical protein